MSREGGTSGAAPGTPPETLVSPSVLAHHGQHGSLSGESGGAVEEPPSRRSFTATTSGTLRHWGHLGRAERLLADLAAALKSPDDVRRVLWSVETSTSEEWHPGEQEPRVRIITRPRWTETIRFARLDSWSTWEGRLSSDTPHRRALLTLWALCLPGGEFRLEPRPRDEDEPEREETAA